MAMKKALRDAWCTKLRDPAYVQIRGTLYGEKENQFCCLGVLAIEMGMERINEANRPQLGVQYGRIMHCIGAEAKERCVDMNDSCDELHRTFPEIADWIEANIPVEE